jgi:hypothetical protein
MTATNKWLLISESRGDLNRCIPCRGKPNQYVTYASHSSPRTPGVRFLRAVPVCDNLSLTPMKSKHAYTPRRSLGNQRQTGPAVVLGDLIPPPMRQPWGRGERFQSNGYTNTSAYWAHIISMRSVHLILVYGGQPKGPLIDTSRCYNLEGASLPRIHSPTFPSSYLRFPLMPCPVFSLTKF